MRLRATCWITLAALTACSGSPIPLPPPENLDLSKIRWPETQPATNVVSFSGGPNSAPPNSLLRITNLDTQDTPVAVPVDADGAFEVTLALSADDELRFQVRRDEERLTPIDALYTDGGFVESTRIDCFTVSLELDFGSVPVGSDGEATLAFENGCDSDAQIIAAALRTADPTFTAGPDIPTSIEAGIALAVPLTFSPSVVGDSEEVLLVSVQIAGADARYPTTLYGLGQ